MRQAFHEFIDGGFAIQNFLSFFVVEQMPRCGSVQIPPSQQI
jgi:hypothetical protein